MQQIKIFTSESHYEKGWISADDKANKWLSVYEIKFKTRNLKYLQNPKIFKNIMNSQRATMR